MYQKFYTNTIQSNFIKYILQNTYIPTVPFTCNVNHITKDCTYIHNNTFVKARKSEDMNQVLKSIEDSPEEYFNYFINYDKYVFGKQYLGLTTNFTSNSDIYDSETHYYLGQYLKAYKAYYGVDLFPYYNCYSNEYITDVDLKLNEKNRMPYIDIINSRPTNYKIISVPISLCQEYTIALDCASELLMIPAFVGKNGILVEQTNILHASLIAAPHEQLHKKENYIHARTNFNQPIYYWSPCIPGKYDEGQLSLVQYEKYLRLLIKIPSNNTSSIAVLQGHFNNVKSNQDKLINLSIEDLNSMLSKTIQKDYIAGNSYNFLPNISYKLKHYGDLNNLFYKYPSAILDPNITSIGSQDDDGFQQKKLAIITDTTYNYDTSFLIYKIKQSRDDAYITFPLETPCLNIKGKELNQLSSSNISDWLLNFSDYSLTEDSQQIFDPRVRLKFRVNDELIDGQSIEIHDKDVVEVKLIGFQVSDIAYYDSAWSTPVIYESSNENSKRWAPNTTIKLDGSVIWQINNNSRYKVTYINRDGKINRDKVGCYIVGGEDGIQIEELPKASDKELVTVSVLLGDTEIVKQSVLYKEPESIINLSRYYNNTIIQIRSNQSSKCKILCNGEINNFPLNNNWSKPIYIQENSNSHLYVKYNVEDTFTFDIISKDTHLVSVLGNKREYEIFNIIIKESELTSGRPIVVSKIEDNIYQIDINAPRNIDLQFKYLDWIEETILNKADINDYLNKYLYNNLSLLYMNDSTSYAFVNRLLEYLSNNVINHTNMFGKNIRRVQDQLKLPNSRYESNINNDATWNDYMRIQAFEFVNNYRDIINQPAFKDINGFIDKDSEQALIKNKALVEARMR